MKKLKITKIPYLICGCIATIFLTAVTNCGHFNPNSDGKTILALTHVVVAHQPGKHLGFPGIALLKNGNLMVVFREATRHGVDKEGKISFVRSCDGGNTWSVPKILYDTPDADDRDPAVLQHSDGTIYVTLASQSYGPVLLKSINGGTNWERVGKTPVFSPHGILENINGDLIYCGLQTVITLIEGAPVPLQAIQIFRSKDKGKTWRDAGTITSSVGWSPKMIHEFYDEPCLAILPNGTWLCMTRVEMDGFLRQWLSLDGGTTWKGPYKMEMKGYPPHILILKNGVLLSTYGYRWRPFGIRGSLSYDNGITWDVKNEIVIRDDGHNEDLGYSVSVQLKDGKILSVYYFNREKNDFYIGGTFIHLGIN